MCENPAAFFLVPHCFNTQEMCIKAVEVDPWQQNDVPDHFKTKNMCDDVAWGDPFSLGFILDWFVTQEQVKLWHDYDDYYDDYKLVEWCDGYQKRNTGKQR